MTYLNTKWVIVHCANSIEAKYPFYVQLKYWWLNFILKRMTIIETISDFGASLLGKRKHVENNFDDFLMPQR